jgi:hypothetical protein
MKLYRLSYIAVMVLLMQQHVLAQRKDTLRVDSAVITPGSPPTVVKRSVYDSMLARFNPRTAALRSAIIPGWGQAYNKKYWKIPIVYAALGITGYVFIDNLKYYRGVRYAYKVLINKDSANFDNVGDEFEFAVRNNYITSLRTARNEVRKNIDYSVLFFIAFWGLNVVDATVDAHLKSFDVSSELSLKIKPNILSNTQVAGLSLVFDIHKAKSKPLTLPQ